MALSREDMAEFCSRQILSTCIPAGNVESGVGTASFTLEKYLLIFLDKDALSRGGMAADWLDS